MTQVQHSYPNAHQAPGCRRPYMLAWMNMDGAQTEQGSTKQPPGQGTCRAAQAAHLMATSCLLSCHHSSAVSLLNCWRLKRIRVS